MSSLSFKTVLVTVTFNAESYISMFMNSLANQEICGTLLIVDNKSTDKTLEKLKEYGNKINTWDIVVLAQDENVGVAEGNNIGIRWALSSNADNIVLINNDVEFEQDALQKLIEYSELNQAVTVPLTFYGDDKTKVWFAGGAMAPWRGHSVHWENQPNGKFTKITYALTCCMVVPANVFKEIGLMDGNYFVYFDDTDFCARLNFSNISIFLIGNAILYHYVSSSTGYNSPLQIYFGERNRLYYINRNVHGFKRYFAILYFVVTRIIRLISYFLQRDKKRYSALLLGIKDYFSRNMGRGSYLKRG